MSLRAVLVFPSILTLLVAALAAHPLRLEGSGDFTAALARVQKNLDAYRGKEAKAALTAALDAHKDPVWVRSQLAEVRRLATACAFQIASPRKTAEDVFGGKVGSFDAKTGKIALRWEKPKESKAKADKDAPKPAFPGEDFETTSWGAVLRAPFAGPYSIELSGKAIGQDVPLVRACITGEFCYEARLDAGELQSISRVEGDKRESLASTSNVYNVARPYRLEVFVRETQIEVKHNGARLVVAAKPKGVHGCIGFRDVLDPQVIEVAGVIDTAWIEEQIAAAVAVDRAKFDASYDVNADLPAWLRIPCRIQRDRAGARAGQYVLVGTPRVSRGRGCAGTDRASGVRPKFAATVAPLAPPLRRRRSLEGCSEPASSRLLAGKTQSGRLAQRTSGAPH
jgi:hypothetical protein